MPSDVLITPASSKIEFTDGNNATKTLKITNTSLNIDTTFGIGTTTPSAQLHINSTTSGGTVLRTDGTNGTLFSVIDDLSSSLMSVNNSAGLPVLEVFADDRVVAGQYGTNDFIIKSNKIGIGTENFSYTINDNSRLVGSNTNNILFVNGSVQLLNNNDAFVIGRGTATFLSDEELGFGWGGGWYMTDTTYLRIRNDKTLYTAGEIWGSIFKDSNNTAYYIDPASTSNLVGLTVANTISGSINGNSATATLATKATRANGNFYIDDNYGNTVVGLYSANRLQGVFAMGDSYKLAADGTGVGTLYGIAWSHPNAGGVASNLSNHGALVLLNGTYAAAISTSIRCTADMRTPIYYDSDNTTYYCDPASTSNLNIITAAGNVTAAQYYTGGWFRNSTSGYGLYNEVTGEHFYSDTADTWNIASSATTQALRLRTGGYNGTIRGYFYATNSNDVGLLNQDGNWRIRVVGGDYVLFDGSSVRAQIFYDSNDTNYYVNPASASVLNSLTVTDANLELYKSQTVDMSNTTTYSTSNYYPVTISIPTEGCIIQIQNNLNSNVPSWATHAAGFTLNLKWRTNGSGWGTTQVKRIIDQYYEQFTNQTICGGITQMTNSSTEVVWLRGGGQYLFKFSRNLSATAQSATYTVNSQSVSPTSTAQNTIWNSANGTAVLYNDTTYSTSNMYTPVLYDYNNSAYYVDPASTSVLNALTVGGNNVLTTASTLTAGNLSGTIPSGVLGNSTVYIGTTAITLNRGSASQSLTGINIDGSSGSCTGNAASATYANSGVRLGSWDGTSYVGGSTAIGSSGGRGVDLAPNTYQQSISFEFKNGSFTTIGGNYAGLITIAPWVGTTASTGDVSYQMLFSSSSANSTTGPVLRMRAGIDTTWGSWLTMLNNNSTLTAGNLSGTIPSAVLGNSSHFIGTTSIALNRASGSQTLTGVSIDGNAGTVTDGVYLSTTQTISGSKTFSVDITVNGIKAGRGVGNVSSNTVFGGSALSSNTTGNHNSTFGYYSLKSNTSGYQNSAFGSRALTSNTTGTNNNAFGYRALRNLTTGISNSAFGNDALRYAVTSWYNCAFGEQALFKNLAGSSNCAFGSQSSRETTASNNSSFGDNSLRYNTIGSANSAFGRLSLYKNTTGANNNAFGHYGLRNNTSGVRNGAFGVNALNYNTIGSDNHAFGGKALYSNTTGNKNNAFGYQALYSNTFGGYNCGFGSYTLYSVSTGSDNTAIGRNAGFNLTTGSNVTCIGANSNPSTGTVSNQITLGNGSITSLRCQVTTITALSDQRDKADIESIDVGLDFIEKLRPVTFKWDKREWYSNGIKDGSKKQNILQTGFIAQELKKLQEENNVEYLKLVDDSNPDKLEATPGNLLVPLIKAVQELSQKVKILENRIHILENR